MTVVAIAGARGRIGLSGTSTTVSARPESSLSGPARGHRMREPGEWRGDTQGSEGRRRLPDGNGGRSRRRGDSHSARLRPARRPGSDRLRELVREPTLHHRGGRADQLLPCPRCLADLPYLCEASSSGPCRPDRCPLHRNGHDGSLPAALRPRLRLPVKSFGPFGGAKHERHAGFGNTDLSRSPSAPSGWHRLGAQTARTAPRPTRFIPTSPRASRTGGPRPIRAVRAEESGGWAGPAEIA